MITIRCVFLGDSGVGKTTILSKLARNNCKISPTIGVDNVLFDDKDIHYQCWDTSGSPQFTAVVDLFSSKSQNKVFIYDSSKPGTFHREKIDSDTLVVANLRKNVPAIDPTHISVNIQDDSTRSHLLAVMRRDFEKEEPEVGIVYNKGDCCLCS